MPSNSLVTIDEPAKAFPALRADAGAKLLVVAQLLREQQFTPFDLDQIRVPSGGGLAWTLPGDDTAAQLAGIVVFAAPARTYYAKSPEESEGTGPPDCHSLDMVRGVGSPGGGCAACPLNQWGTARKGGKGKACKEVRRLFLLRPGEILPAMLVLPPTSIKAWRKFSLGLASRGLPYFGAVAAVGLERQKNAAGTVYSSATLQVVSELEGTPEPIIERDEVVRVNWTGQIGAIQRLGEDLRRVMEAAVPDREAVLADEA